MNTTILRTTKSGRGKVGWVTVGELATWQREGRKLHVVDVREPERYARGHLPFALNIPDSNSTALVRSIPKDRFTVLVCDDGEMSKAVGRTLDFCGYDQVIYLQGGLQAWKDAGYAVAAAPVTKSIPKPAPAPAPAPDRVPEVSRACRFAIALYKGFTVRVVYAAAACVMAILYLYLVR